PEKIGINVEMHSYAFSSPGDTRYIILHYDLKNPGATVISNLYAGIFLDWDIGAFTYDVNVSAFDATRSLGYAFDNSRAERAYLGIRALDSAASYRTLINDGTLDLSRFAKFDWISKGVFGTASSPNDIHHVISAGPFVLSPGGSQKVGFALVAAESSLTQLQEAADAAKAKWLEILNPVSVEHLDSAVPLTFGLEQNFPNPFNPSTTIGFRVAREEFISMNVFDMLGRHVATLVDEIMNPGLYQAHWDARTLSSGIYYYRLRAGSFVETRKMVLMR
ncbi:MAG: T9SS type A sorting domain-containing protein, partial [Bacteroidota bacterium]